MQSARTGRSLSSCWCLRPTKGHYALLRYSHRLDKDFLFKALLNYVERTIRLEEGRLQSFPNSNKEAGQMEIDILSEMGVAYFPELRYFLGQENWEK